MDVLAKIQKSKGYHHIVTIYNVVAAFCVLFTFWTIIKSILVSFNWIPGYYVEWRRIDSVAPIVYFFPEDKLRLDFDLYGDIQKSDVDSVVWSISKGGTFYKSSNDFSPTFKLSLPEGGIYNLNIVATLKDGQAKRKGNINLYVVDDAKIVTVNKPASVKLTKENTSPELLKKIQSTKEVEIYSGHGQWKSVPRVSTTTNSVTIELPTNSSISTFDNQVLFRAKSSTNSLNDYGSGHFQYRQ